MAQNDDVTLTINLRWSREGRWQKNTADKPIQLAIQNVGFRAAKNRQTRLKQNLHRDFAPIVERELQSMANDVSRMAIGLSNPNNPPPGVLTTPGRISRPMIGNTGPMSISSMTGTWATRTKPYMKWKLKRYNTRRWFFNTGQLQRQLRSVGTYRNAYGPVSIKFTPTAMETVPGGVSNLGRSAGGQSTRIMIGRLEVSALRRLRLGDLPGIGQQAQYNERLLSPLATSVRRKLAGKKDKYRPVIEPFLTYYLTRRIPNAVYRRLEDSLA